MAETDSRPQSDTIQDSSAKGRAKADPAHDEAAVRPERRSFAEAGQTVGRMAGHAVGEARGATEAGIKASKDMAEAGQDAARRAGTQAVDLWRASLDPLASLQNEFSRWFEQTWREAIGGRLPGAPMFGESLFAAFAGSPSADVYETENALELSLDLPGMTAQDIHLSMRGDVLIVSGQRSETTDRGEGAYRVRERRAGRFERSFALPAGADRNRIEARFDHGVLKVTIPRTSDSKLSVERIPIKG